jgi:hypothetical protein
MTFLLMQLLMDTGGPTGIYCVRFLDTKYLTYYITINNYFLELLIKEHHYEKGRANRTI